MSDRPVVVLSNMFVLVCVCLRTCASLPCTVVDHDAVRLLPTYVRKLEGSDGPHCIICACSNPTSEIDLDIHR